MDLWKCPKFVGSMWHVKQWHKNEIRMKSDFVFVMFLALFCAWLFLGFFIWFLLSLFMGFLCYLFDSCQPYRIHLSSFIRHHFSIPFYVSSTSPSGVAVGWLDVNEMGGLGGGCCFSLLVLYFPIISAMAAIVVGCCVEPFTFIFHFFSFIFSQTLIFYLLLSTNVLLWRKKMANGKYNHSQSHTLNVENKRQDTVIVTK